jgi:hypothetical protein
MRLLAAPAPQFRNHEIEHHKITNLTIIDKKA